MGYHPLAGQQYFDALLGLFEMKNVVPQAAKINKILLSGGYRATECYGEKNCRRGKASPSRVLPAIERMARPCTRVLLDNYGCSRTWSRSNEVLGLPGRITEED